MIINCVSFYYVFFIIFDVSLFTNWAMIGKIKVYFDACYSDNVPDVAFNDINKIFLNNSIAQISLLLGQTESLTNELKNSSNYGLMYVFHPKAYNIDLNSFSNNCGYHELINVFLKNNYLQEFTAYCTSTKFKTTRTVLTFPIFSDTEKNIIMFIVFDLFKNDYFIFSPFFDINLNNVKEPIFSPCQTPHETIIARVIFICDVLRFNRLSTKSLKKRSEEVITVQSPVDTFIDWESNLPRKISIISKKHGEEMIALEEDYKLYVNTLFFDKFMKNSPLLFEVVNEICYVIPLKSFMERSEMFNFEITDDAKCDKTTIFGLNDDGFLDYIAKYTHKKVSYLKLPVDESSNDDESFKNMNKVVEKTPESIESIDDSMKELKERFVASMEVFEKCVKINTINANLMKECISKFDDLEKTIKSKNKLNDTETHVSEHNNQLEGLNIGNADSKKVDTVINNSNKPDIANVVGVPDSTSSDSSSTPANVSTKTLSIIQSNTPTNISTNVSANSSSSTPSSTPSNIQSSIQPSKQTNVPTNVTTNVPSSTPFNVTTNTPTSIPTSIPTNTPSISSTPASNSSSTSINVSTKAPSITPPNASSSSNQSSTPADVPNNAPSSTSCNSSSNALTTAPSRTPIEVSSSNSYSNSEVRMLLINAIDINNKDLRDYEIEQLDELLYFILNPVPDVRFVPYIYSFEFELFNGNFKQNYESMFSGIESKLLSKWIYLRCSLLKDLKLVKTGMIVKTSGGPNLMMCSPNLLDVVSRMVDSWYIQEEYFRKVFYFLVHYFLDLPPFRAKWKQQHRNIYNKKKILIVKNSEEKFAEQGNWRPNKIYTLLNHQVVKRIYDKNNARRRSYDE